MAIEQLLSSTRGLFFSLHETWCEASLVVRTAAVATPLFTLAGTVYLLRPRSLPVEKVKVEPKVPKEKEEEGEGEQGVHILVVKVDWVALNAAGIFESDEWSDEEEVLIEKKSSPSVLQDLFVRKGAFSELIGELEKRVTPLLGVVGGATGNKPEPILKALGRLKKAGEPLIAAMIDNEVAFDMSRWIERMGYFLELLDTADENPDVKINPQWAKKLDAFFKNRLKNMPYTALKYTWSGIVEASYKFSVFNVRIPAVRLAVTKLAPIDEFAKKHLDKWGGDKKVVKEVYGALFDLALALFDATTGCLWDHSDHKAFDLFWNNRAELYEEAGEGKSKLMTQIVNQALSKVPLSSLKKALK